MSTPILRFLPRPGVLLGLLCLTSGPALAAPDSQCPPLLQQSFTTLQGDQPVSLCQYQGKVLLVVNTASYCGYTKQYDGLEKLYARLKDRGLVVLGFPSNDFGGQEPGSNEEIADFCRLTYGVEFPMVGKTVVKGPTANPFYRRLAEITGSPPQWNFHKYLISRDGTQVRAYPSKVTPDDPELLRTLEDFLK